MFSPTGYDKSVFSEICLARIVFFFLEISIGKKQQTFFKLIRNL